MKKDNLILVAEAMKFPEVIKLVSNASDRIWHKVRDVTSFENTCYRNIGQALVSEKVRSVGGIASRIISRAEAWHVKHRGTEHTQSLESLAGLDDEGNEEPFEIIDVLADVESMIVSESYINEKVALLAKDDSRDLAILNAWLEGEFNNLEIARALAGSFGGKTDSHYKHITRFKTKCEKRLAAA